MATHNPTWGYRTVRSVFIVDPDDRLRLMLTYPKSVGRNFDEIVRVIDALQATDADPIATPADWQPGDRVIVALRSPPRMQTTSSTTSRSSSPTSATRTHPEPPAHDTRRAPFRSELWVPGTRSMALGRLEGLHSGPMTRVLNLKVRELICVEIQSVGSLVARCRRQVSP